MAVALQSNSSYKIVSQDGSERNKSVFLVKLTDSCLKNLEQHKNQTAKISRPNSSRKPSIQFKDKGKSGVLFIPDKSGGGSEKDGTTFNFNASSVFNDSSTVGLDCFQQKKGDMGLILLGNVTEKITVSANNDSYQATRNRMAEAQNKRKDNSAKVIEVSQADGNKKAKRTPIQRQMNSIRKLKTKAFGQTSSGSSKGLREKVVHLLALRPLKKIELRAKLEKDGVKLKDATVLSNILQQVAVMQDNQYNLNRHLYTEIQADSWPCYTDEEREIIKNKLVSEMEASVDRLSPGPLASGLCNNNSSKRPLSRAVLPVGKKPRIAHSANPVVKNERKPTSNNSPPKLTSQPVVTQTIITPTNATQHHHKLNNKLQKSSTNKSDSGKAGKNDSNNNNCSLTEKESDTNEDYLIKYPEISSYEQRCSYKEEFTRGYLEYTAIKERSDLVSQEFSSLKERLKNQLDDCESAKELHAEILKLYEEKKDKWTKDRKIIEHLHPKLSHIKRLVIQYDQVHASS